MMNKHFVRGCVLLAGLSLCAPALARTEKNPAIAEKVAPLAVPPTLPQGVAGADGKTGYVRGFSGGIDALDLATGKELWHSDDASKPLAALGIHLVAQTLPLDKPNAVQIVFLDGKNQGKAYLRWEPIVLPDWVEPASEFVSGGGKTFSSFVTFAGNTLLYHWSATSHYAGGAAPPPEIEEAARNNASGVVAVDLATGKPDREIAHSIEAIPALPPLADAATQSYWTGLAGKTTPLVSGANATALVLEQNPGSEQQTLMLQKWNTKSGKAEAALPLMTGFSLWPQFTPDGRYAFVQQQVPSDADVQGKDAATIFSMESGACIGKVALLIGLNSVGVIGRTAFLVQTVNEPVQNLADRFGPQPQTLVAIDLPSGKTLWKYQIAGRTMLMPRP